MNGNLSQKLSELFASKKKVDHKTARPFQPQLETLEVREVPSAAPLLGISANGRYLVNASTQQPFYLVGDTAWALPAGLTFGTSPATDTVDQYFQTRASQGYNAVLMDADVQLGASPVGAPQRGPLDANGNAPFTGMVNGTYDVSTPNPVYWQNIHNIVATAGQNGIQVVLDVYDNYNPWFTGGNSPNSIAKLTAYGQFLGNEFKDLPNIIWMLGNDYSENSAGDADFQAVMSGIRQNDTQHLGWATDQYGATFDNTGLRSSLQLNTIYEYSTGPWRSLYLSQYDRSDFGPTLNIESGYENNSSLGMTEADLREEHYSFLLAGATGDMYGNEDIWPFDDSWRSWQNALTSQGAHEMTYLTNFVNAIPWNNLIPDQTGQGEATTLFQNVGSTTDYSGAFVGAANGTSVTLAVAYKPSTGTGSQSFTVGDMTKFVGSVTAQWYDPTNGTYTAAGTFANSGSHTFTSPSTNSAGQNDFVLVLQASATAPAAPTGVTATAANTQVALAWTASSGAVSYNIYRSTSSGTEVKIATTPATVIATSYTDTGLTNGTKYYYKITAVNSAGESGLSSEVSAPPVLAAPTVPTNVSAASSNNQVALTWSAVAGATSYNIYRSTATGTEVKVATSPATVTTTSYTDTGLTNGTKYFYQVTAVNAAGESGKSSEVSAIPSSVSYVQSASTGSDASAATIAQAFTTNTTSGNMIVVAVTWDTTTGITTAPTLSDTQGNTYTLATYANDTRHNQALAIYYAPGIKGGADTVTANFGVSQAYRRLLINEYSGLAGTVDVTASNIGTGNVPTSNSAVTTSAGDLVFGAFMDDSGTTTITAGTGFNQRQFNSGDTTAQDMIQSAAGAIASTANFAASTDYLAQMVAFKTGGATTVAPPTITSQPSSATVNAGTAASFTVVANGTAPLTYQWQKLINGTWTNISSGNTSAFTGATTPTFKITAPVASDAGSYWVVVTNSAGTAISSTVTLAVNVSATAPTITAQPSSLTVNLGQSATFSVAASGTAPLTYQWQKQINGTWTNISGATSSTYTISAPAAADAGSYHVIITNAAGSITSSTATLTVNAAVVGTGTGLTGQYFNDQTLTNLVLTRTDATVNFNWGSGSPDPSLPVDHFSVRWIGQVQAQFTQTYTFYTDSDDGVRLWVNGVEIINNWTDHANTENSATIALVAGQKYDIKMEYYENGGQAVAKLLWSSPSTAKLAIPTSQLYVATATAPAAPTGVTAASGNGQDLLSWTAVSGSTIYNIYRSTTSGTEVKINSATGTTFTDTGLTNGTKYYYQVTAVNSVGESSKSSEVSATPTATLTIGETTITPSDDNGNANLLLAQKTTLAQAGTLQSLSFYVTQAAGSLILGVYDASGPNGGPGKLLAQTSSFTPVVGWNTVNVTTPVHLTAGTYWLAYLPSDNNLHFRVDRTSGTLEWYAYAFGPMASTFSTTPNTETGHWSFYATLTPG